MAYQEVRRVLEHSTQKNAARLVMIVIAEHADENGFAFPSAEKIAKEAALSSRHVERVISQLKDTRELYVLAGGGRWKSNRYVVLVGCDRSEAARRIQFAYRKMELDLSMDAANKIIVKKWGEIMQDGDENTDISSNETPTNDPITPTFDVETPTNGTENTDILSKNTPTNHPVTPTNDPDTPTSCTETPTQESDEPIEPSLNHQVVEPSGSEKPSDSNPPDLNSEREPEEPSNLLSLVGYPEFRKKVYEITGRNPELDQHQKDVDPFATKWWGIGYQVADLVAAAKRCDWMTTPPRPAQLEDYLGVPASGMDEDDGDGWENWERVTVEKYWLDDDDEQLPMPATVIDSWWIAVKGSLELTLNRATYDTWIADLEFVSHEDGVLTITARNAMAQGWVTERMGQRLMRLYRDMSKSVVNSMRLIAPYVRTVVVDAEWAEAEAASGD